MNDFHALLLFVGMICANGNIDRNINQKSCAAKILSCIADKKTASKINIQAQSKDAAECLK